MFRAISRENGSIRWKGDYHTWQDALNASGGYDAAGIFNEVVEAAGAVRDGKALWERDTVCFNHEEYDYFLIASLMTAAAGHGGKLHVLDFGGALGSSYMQHRKLLDRIDDFSWSIIEQPHVVACGRAQFSTDRLHFFEKIEEALVHGPINTFLFSSVLQYLESPYDLLQDVLKYNPGAIIVSRTPLSTVGERITVQHVPDWIYAASYPCRFLDRRRIEGILASPRIFTPWQHSAFDHHDFYNTMSLNPRSKREEVS